MQGSQFESHYDGMIITDPNLILNVTVPETVQKQAENWVRGTRALFFKSHFNPAQQQPTKDSIGEQRLCSEVKTNEQPNPPRTEERVEKNSQQPPKEDVSEVLQPTPAESSEKIYQVQVTGLHMQQSASVTLSCDGDECPRLLPNTDDPAKSFYDQEQQKVQDVEEYCSSQTDYINNVTSFEHCFPRASVQPLCHQDSGIHSYPLINDASECELINFSSGHTWLPNEYLQCNIQPQAGTEILQEDSSLTAWIDGDRNDLCWGTAELHATDVYRSFSPTMPSEVQHTTMALASRRSQHTVPARKSRWMDANVGSSTYFTVPKKSSKNRHRYADSCNGERGHQQPMASLWCGSHRPFQQPAQDNVVLRSVSATSAALSPEKQRPLPEDLIDLSVEETVDYFLKMTSPLGGEFDDHQTNTAPLFLSDFDALAWNFLQPISSTF